MGSKAKAPAPNPQADYDQYLTEARNALKVQSTLLPEQAVLEERIAPTLINTRMAGLRASSQGLMGLYGDLYAPAQELQQRYATDQLNMLGGLGSLRVPPLAPVTPRPVAFTAPSANRLLATSRLVRP